MSDSAEAIFPDQAAPAAEAPVVEPTPTEPAPAVEAAPAAEAQPEPALTPPAPTPEPTDRHVPITALLDEREKRQAAEREAEQLRAKIPQAQPANMPDPYEDPQGFEQHVQSRVQEVIKTERLNTSYQIATVRHGREAVEEARVWAIDRAQKDPAFSASLDMQSDPVDWIVHQHKRDGLLSQIGDKSLEDFIREQVASDPTKYGLTAPVVAATPPSAVIAQPAPKAAVPPRSIASDATAPAAATDPSADFMAIFKR
jgi:hypothetical protein